MAMSKPEANDEYPDEGEAAGFHGAVYDELRRIAASYMARERAEHTLQPTALVHEAFVRMGSSGADAAGSRALFFYTAARAMRQILIDHARSLSSSTRHAVRVELDDALEAFESRAIDLMDLTAALEGLEKQDAYLARIVDLRFFAGLSTEEISVMEDRSPRTLQRDLQFARAWLRTELDRGVEEDA